MFMDKLSKKDIQKNIKIPTKLTPLLAELCGIHIGDGYLGFRPIKNDYLIQCTGNLKDDKEYYDNRLREIWKNLFNVNPKFIERKDNTYDLRVYSKGISLFLNEFLNLPFGKKARIIKIPDIVKETCKDNISEEMKSCLRGIIDTDFYFVLDRKYPELGAWFASRDLILDLHEYLRKAGLKPRIRLDVKYFNTSSRKELTRHQIRIRRKKDIKRWFNEIGINNPKIYKRYQDFM